MNVAVWLRAAAAILATYLTFIVASPLSSRPMSAVSISTWPGPPTS